MSLPNTVIVPHGATEAALVDWLRNDLKIPLVIHGPYGRQERTVSMKEIADVLGRPPFDGDKNGKSCC